MFFNIQQYEEYENTYEEFDGLFEKDDCKSLNLGV